jgi:hypothetical protein
MKKSLKIALGSFFMIIAAGHVGYFISENYGLDMNLQKLIYLLISFLLFLALSVVFLFLISTRESTEINSDLKNVTYNDDISASGLIVKKIDGKKLVARKNPDSYKYQKESNPALAFLVWMLSALFVGGSFFVWYFYVKN